MPDEGTDPECMDIEDSSYEVSFHGYHNLMRHKIQRVLLVSSLYDAFILEEDGGLSERIFGEYRDLDLTSPPRIYRVPTGQKALEELENQSYDLVISMTQIFDYDPIDFGKKAKQLQPGIPMVLLVTDSSTLSRYYHPGEDIGFDKVFMWQGDSSLFVAIVKYFEDRLNVAEDTANGLVRVILVVEDNIRYFSTFLPALYMEVLKQTRDLVALGLNEHEKLLRRRARPKILLAETYEEGMALYEEYHDFIMGVLSDVTYPKGGKRCPDAGFQFLAEVDRHIPTLLQSSGLENAKKAAEKGIAFIGKTSPTLIRDLRYWMKAELGFGDFIFTDEKGNEVARARSIKEMAQLLKQVPGECLEVGGKANRFSKWFFARGEFELAQRIRYTQFVQFGDVEAVRTFLKDRVREMRQKNQQGVITDFERQSFEFDETVTRVGGGSLGGKGRGIAFLSLLLRRTTICEEFGGHDIVIPDTLIIGTDLFDAFMEMNDFTELVSREKISNDEIMQRFIVGDLPNSLTMALRTYLENVDGPLAVRSSSLLEDSMNQPFAGIYHTYILPNDEDKSSKDRRLRQLCDAVKMVYASIYSKMARAYIQSTNHAIEEEKMAVVIQKLAGNRYGDRFYPIFSGVALSRNYYPMPPLERDWGIASIALGLGKIVVEGGKVLSFSPRNPNVIPGFSSTTDILRNAQNRFISLDMTLDDFDLTRGEEETLLELDVSDAIDGPLARVSSTYDPGDDRIRDSGFGEGYKVVTFSSILNYDTYPLPQIIQQLLNIGERGIGGPVEIEFAVSEGEGEKLIFHLVQIRPISPMREDFLVDIGDEPDRKTNLVHCSRAMGNGIIDGIRDIVFVPPSTFDRGQTPAITKEIETVNQSLDGRPFMLIGPGRWGSSDRWLGIPVDWSQISSARAIVETPMQDIVVDPSYGSHFFHNMTALGIPYLMVTSKDFVDWEWLDALEPTWEGVYVKHVTLDQPAIVKVDGKQGMAVAMKPMDGE